MNRGEANWIGHTLRRSCLLKHVIEGQIKGSVEVMGRRGRRRKQLLYDLKKKTAYWKPKKEALDRAVRRTGFGKGHRPVARHNME